MDRTETVIPPSRYRREPITVITEGSSARCARFGANPRARLHARELARAFSSERGRVAVSGGFAVRPAR